MRKSSRLSAAEVDWRPEYIDLDGITVLIVIVDPPAQSDPIHTLWKDINSRRCLFRTEPVGIVCQSRPVEELAELTYGWCGSASRVQGQRSSLDGKIRFEREVRIVERRVEIKERVVTKETVKRFATRSTRASARLERRTLPDGYVRSAKVERFLAERRPQV